MIVMLRATSATETRPTSILSTHITNFLDKMRNRKNEEPQPREIRPPRNRNCVLPEEANNTASSRLTRGNLHAWCPRMRTLTCPCFTEAQLRNRSQKTLCQRWWHNMSAGREHHFPTALATKITLYFQMASPQFKNVHWNLLRAFTRVHHRLL